MVDTVLPVCFCRIIIVYSSPQMRKIDILAGLHRLLPFFVFSCLLYLIPIACSYYFIYNIQAWFTILLDEHIKATTQCTKCANCQLFLALPCHQTPIMFKRTVISVPDCLQALHSHILNLKQVSFRLYNGSGA